jgi:hypothetical protein
MRRGRILAGALVLAFFAAPTAAFAQDGMTVNVAVTQSCGTATFEVTAEGGAAPYSLTWDFGDGETQLDSPVAGFPFTTSHTYAAAGQMEWSLLVADASDPAVSASTGGTLTLGPQATLTSDIFPPLLTLEGGQATLNFTASASGGEPPYSYAWDLDGDGVYQAGTEQASFTYTAGGKYVAAVQVTDNCGLTALATLPVVVVDPEAEACHPMAQRIADAVSMLFPTQADMLYTCEDIFAIFQGSLTGNQLGFGRMWHAVKLAATLEDMTWEEILQWQLDGTGWGLLAQLDRFAETLGDIGPGELALLVVSGQTSVGDIRTAVRMVTRYDVDFADALARVSAGANPGELGQLYRMASDLALDPAALDVYLEQGMSLAELRHAARLAQQSGSELDLMAGAHASGMSWGEIKQALREAEDGGDLSAILAAGGEETRQEEREQQRQEQQSASDTRTAERLAERYGTTVDQVLALFNGSCAGDWGCVQTALKGENDSKGPGEHGGGKK